MGAWVGAGANISHLYTYMYMKDLHDSELKHVHLNVAHVRSVYNFRYLQITIKYFLGRIETLFRHPVPESLSGTSPSFTLWSLGCPRPAPESSCWSSGSAAWPCPALPSSTPAFGLSREWFWAHHGCCCCLAGAPDWFISCICHFDLLWVTWSRNLMR